VLDDCNVSRGGARLRTLTLGCAALHFAPQDDTNVNAFEHLPQFLDISHEQVIGAGRENLILFAAIDQ
jgi:hypothetical protein